MFDWNDHDQVGHTIWGELNESEDHIVPYPKDTDGDVVFTFGDYGKKQKHATVRAVGSSTTQTSGVENEFPGGSLENSSIFNANGEVSASRPDIDTWPDLPALSAELSNGSGQNSLEKELINKVTGNLSGFCNTSGLLNRNELSSLNESCSFSAGGTVQLGIEPEPFGNEHEDKESDSYLDCDWANIGDFDDLDKIFRNDSIFGHDMVDSVDQFLSPSADVICSTAQSIPMPDIPLNRDQPPDHDSSFQLVEHSGGKRKTEEKTTDITVETREQTNCRAHVTNQVLEKENRKKKLLKSRKKAEERSKNKASQNFHDQWSLKQYPCPNLHLAAVSPSRTFQSPAISHTQNASDAEHIGHLGSSNQYVFAQYGYPAYPFSSTPVLPHLPTERNQTNHAAVGQKLHPDPLKHSPTSSKLPDMQSRPVAMTPQEKIEKLRRRQQVQAMLAIQQQQQQLAHQTTGAENFVPNANCQKNQKQDSVTSNMCVEENVNRLPSSDISMSVEHDESQRISTLIDDNCLEETIYYQLQDALEKLDVRVRLCIRDSLFRLARSSMERQSASDRSSTNNTRDENGVPANEKIANGKRQTKLADEETYTNPVDRTVAHFLFSRPSESCTRLGNGEMLQSPISSNSVFKLPLKMNASTYEGQPESFREIEMQTSL